MQKDCAVVYCPDALLQRSKELRINRSEVFRAALQEAIKENEQGQQIPRRKTPASQPRKTGAT